MSFQLFWSYAVNSNANANVHIMARMTLNYGLQMDQWWIVQAQLHRMQHHHGDFAFPRLRSFFSGLALTGLED